MEKKFEVSEQILLKAKHLCSVTQFVKLSFMIKIFGKWREVMVLNFQNLALKRHWKSMENAI